MLRHLLLVCLGLYLTYGAYFTFQILSYAAKAEKCRGPLALLRKLVAEREEHPHQFLSRFFIWVIAIAVLVCNALLWPYDAWLTAKALYTEARRKLSNPRQLYQTLVRWYYVKYTTRTIKILFDKTYFSFNDVVQTANSQQLRYLGNDVWLRL